MYRVIFAIVFCAVAGLGMSVAEAASTVTDAGQGSPVRLAEAGNDQGNQDVLITEEQQRRYKREMEQQVNKWRRKVEQATEQGGDKARQLGEAGQRKLKSAWGQVQQDWEKVKDASGEAWQKSREKLDRSMDELHRQWKDLTS